MERDKIRENLEQGTYETLGMDDGYLVWGTHFSGTFNGEREGISKIGTLGFLLEDWDNRHDSNYLYFKPLDGVDLEELYPTVLKYMKNRPFAVDWKDSR